MPWVPALTSVFIVSLLSFIGLLGVLLSMHTLRQVMFILISFAAGTLLGGAFFHILPELVLEAGFGFNISLSLLGAIVLFYLLENILHWHHYHHIGEEDRHPVGMLNLIGDGFHNLIDGMIIGAAYLVDFNLGLVTTLAVALHEIPQEIGDFSILIYSGFSQVKALLLNFISALVAFVGVFIALWFGQITESVLPILLAFTAGGFIYIATVDLIPKLHQELYWRKSMMQLIFLILGIGMMAAFTFLE